MELPQQVRSQMEFGNEMSLNRLAAHQIGNRLALAHDAVLGAIDHDLSHARTRVVI